jgi:hypothetical protein
MAMNKQCPKTVRIRCLRALTAFLEQLDHEQLDQLGASTLAEKTKGI